MTISRSQWDAIYRLAPPEIKKRYFNRPVVTSIPLPKGADGLLNLSDVQIAMIFTYSRDNDLKRISATCRRFYDLRKMHVERRFLRNNSIHPVDVLRAINLRISPESLLSSLKMSKPVSLILKDVLVYYKYHVEIVEFLLNSWEIVPGADELNLSIREKWPVEITLLIIRKGAEPDNRTRELAGESYETIQAEVARRSDGNAK